MQTILKSLRWKFEKPKLHIPTRISHMLGTLGTDLDFAECVEKELRSGAGGEQYINVNSNVIQTEVLQILQDLHKQDKPENIFSVNGEVGIPIREIYYAVNTVFIEFLNKHESYEFFNLDTLFNQEGIGKKETETTKAFLRNESSWNSIF